MRRLRIFLALLLAKCVWVASCRTAGTEALNGTDTADVLPRLRYLLSRHVDPEFFDVGVLSPGGVFEGEWRLVSLSMTAAAITNLAHAGVLSKDDAARSLDALIEVASRPEARAFDTQMWNEDALASLDNLHGHVGYLGHLAFMMAARHTLEDTSAIRPELAAVSEALARRMNHATSKHIETYPGEIYTADNAVAAAALSLVNREAHAATLAAWVDFTRTHLLDDKGLIRFGVNSQNRASGLGRGSAAGYNSFYLPFVDGALAREQRAAMNRHLRVTVLGAAAFREHESGWSLGDVDSGPLVFGLSPAATGFFIAGARHGQSPDLLGGLLLTAEIAGFTVPVDGFGQERCYLLAPLVGDAIVLAMRTARPWTTVRQ